MEERKIMVEVTEEEYEKIKVGILEKDIPTYESIKKDLLEKMSDEDVKMLLDKHIDTILTNILDEYLIGQIIKRTIDRSNNVEQISYMDAVSNKEYTIIKGSLEHLLKRDHSQWGTKSLLESNDVFDWSLKEYH